MDQNERLDALIHYICHKCDDPSKLGKTKLNKILWNIDALMFRRMGRTVSGATYIKKPHGPVPAGVDDAIRRLEESNALAVKQKRCIDYVRNEFFAKNEPDMTGFQPDDIHLSDFVIEEICNGFTAQEISERSHNRIWQAAQMGEEIPIYAVLAANEGELTPEDRDWLYEQVHLLEQAAS
jgi:hypothetical protein